MAEEGGQEQLKHAEKLVVKVCKDDGDGYRYDSILNEKWVLQKLSGLLHVVQLVDFFEDKSELFICYMVLKHAGTVDLEDFIKNTSNATRANYKLISSQLLNAIDEVHSVQVCHRDIKPDNIMIKVGKTKDLSQ